MSQIETTEEKMPKTKLRTDLSQWEKSNRFISSPSEKGKFSRLETQITGRSSGISVTATIEPMFLGLLLRGWITEREQRFLDDLVPSRSLSFLISGKTYIHPAGIELFPYDLIEASIKQRNPAIFTHLCPSADRLKSSDYKINTVILNPDESQPLVFGVFGPDHELATAEFEGKFWGLTDCLRSGFRTARKAESLLREKEVSEKPTIIINRASGRVIAVNQSAVDYFGVSERTLVDQEFAATRTLLPEMMVGSKRHIENVTCNGLNLSLVSTTVAEDLRPSEAELTGFLTREIESRLDLLSDAHGNLNDNARQNPDPEFQDFEGLSHNLVTHIKHDLEKINLLASPSLQANHQTNILWELNRAVDTVRRLPGRPREIQVNNRSVNLEHRAPETLLANLFETILMAHQTGSSEAIRTDIHVLRSADADSVCVKVKTRISRAKQDCRPHEGWIACAEFLARQAGVSMERRSEAQDNTLVTMIIIKQNKEL